MLQAMRFIGMLQQEFYEYREMSTKESYCDFLDYLHKILLGIKGNKVREEKVKEDKANKCSGIYYIVSNK